MAREGDSGGDVADGRLARRVAELEELVTYQERALEELNEVVVEQGQTLERLLTRVEALANSVRKRGGEVRPSTEEEPPPHY